MSNISSTVFADTKPHYHLLDGLRGVAALMVIWYHVFEGYAFAGGTTIDTFNHGYLAVDFFFILSGFVIGYAYDDRWGKNFTMKDFIKRRLIRLHPMVIMGAVVGAITFYIQGSVQWDGTHIGISMVMLSLLCTIFFIPAMPGVGYEVRGNGEMFPLNGPCWSLFFEYIGNILYALFIRRLSNKALTIVVVLLGTIINIYAYLRGDLRAYVLKYGYSKNHYGKSSTKQFDTWLEALRNLRNICAHHNILVGKTSSVVLPEAIDVQLLLSDTDLFSRLYALKKILPVSEHKQLKHDLQKLINHSKIDISSLGMLPKDWESRYDGIFIL